MNMVDANGILTKSGQDITLIVKKEANNDVGAHCSNGLSQPMMVVVVGGGHYATVSSALQLSILVLWAVVISNEGDSPYAYNRTLASDYQCGEQTIDLIVKALQRSINFDLREHEYDKPLFKQNICDFNSLKTGTKLTGKISNVTHFGAFVDIGVGTNGLIHTSNMRGHRVALGNKVEVEVMSVESERKRIALRLLKII